MLLSNDDFANFLPDPVKPVDGKPESRFGTHAFIVGDPAA